MELASHNTMSYLKPQNWWLYPFKFMAQCQSKDVFQQYAMGCNLFDLRFAWDKNNEVHFVHGMMMYSNKKITPEKVLDILNGLSGQDRTIWVRVLCERPQDNEKFKEFCKYIEEKYKFIKFYGANDKKTWKTLYNFNNGSPKATDKYSSWNNDTKLGTGWHLDDLFPRIYAMCFNKMWRKKFANYDGFLLQDFLGVY